MLVSISVGRGLKVRGKKGSSISQKAVKLRILNVEKKGCKPAIKLKMLIKFIFDIG